MGLRDYKYFESFSAGTVFIRQNLTSVDVRFWRIKTVPALKRLMPCCGLPLCDQQCVNSAKSVQSHFVRPLGNRGTILPDYCNVLWKTFLRNTYSELPCKMKTAKATAVLEVTWLITWKVSSYVTPSTLRLGYGRSPALSSFRKGLKWNMKREETLAQLQLHGPKLNNNNNVS